MSDEMSSWRSLASSASRSIKGYAAQHDLKSRIPTGRNLDGPTADSSVRQTWGQWAGQKLRVLTQSDPTGSGSIEKLSLFPGWATRRYRQQDTQITNLEGILCSDVPFDVELFISGFSSKYSGLGFGTRPARAFLRLAKSYAALPKIAAPPGAATIVVSSSELDTVSEELRSIHLPPPPDQMNEEAEIRELEEQLKHMESNPETASQLSNSSSAQSESGANTPISETISTNLHRWHANLEARLHPFWSSALSARTVRISVYATDPTAINIYDSPPLNGSSDDEYDILRRPIAVKDVFTAADGSFQVKFTLEWEQMCVHPGGLQIAFGDPTTEFNVYIVAELLPPSSRPNTPSTSQPPQYAPRQPRRVVPTVQTNLSIPLTHSAVRVISDIDDTVKMAGVLQGARAAFHNVFVKDLSDIVIPGMGEWYTSMWSRGVRFHYVSNSPFELLPVVNDFFQLSGLPPGSLKLKCYAGRSLFNGLLSAPAERKRAGVTDILDSFPQSRFFLVGDSGEQDLELYASIARERPNQVLGIFIRDANLDVVPPLEDPTGDRALRKMSRNGFGLGVNGNGNGTGQGALPIKLPSPVAIAPNPPPTGRSARRRPSRSVSDIGSPTHTTPRMTAKSPTRTHSMADIPTSMLSVPYPYGKNGLPIGSYSPGIQTTHSSPNILSESPTSEEPPSMVPPLYPRQNSFSFSSSSRSSTSLSLKPLPSMTDAEKRQYDMQNRIWRARILVPERIPIRIFRDPRECVEWEGILDEFRVGLPR
ncbi:hypothetical protein C8Q75DRAFT_807439 [Abortiporus biennis]|nr:hypothetical protein C8Q75DRAFT_807439 [Abortiporus biennis]